MSGPLRGQGVLAIWNGATPGFDAEFIHWHVNEHIPERLSVPGFLRARRYAALEGTPAYFNFYEVASPDVLTSEAYLARLNAPTEWTQKVLPNFTDMSRTLCQVVESAGAGVGGFVCALRLSTDADALKGLVAELVGSRDICAAHLLGASGAVASPTAEARMRGRPDQTAASILLIEGASAQALKAAAEAGGASDAAILRRSGAAPEYRGLYQLDFLMDGDSAS